MALKENEITKALTSVMTRKQLEKAYIDANDQIDEMMKFIENMNTISKSVAYGGQFDHVEIYKWTKELMKVKNG